MLVGKFDQTQMIIYRKKKYGELSSFHEPLSPSKYMSPKFNSLDFERPLKNNSENLSFKGLSFGADKDKNLQHPQQKKKRNVSPTLIMLATIAAAGVGLRLAPAYKKAGEYSIAEFEQFTDKYLGPMGKQLFENLKSSKSNSVKHLVKISGDKVTLYKKTIPQLIWDGMIYPFKILPGDILNGTVGLLGKIKPLKNWSEKTLQKPLFKNIRQRSKMDAKVNALRGLVETQQKLSSKLSKGEITEEQLKNIIFQNKMKMFDSSKGNYDTKHERTLVRLVSGLPPAIFLANDAYNLSRILDDNPKNAEKEKQTRFRQEAARVGLNAYITLVTMGALQKYINNSKFGNFLLTAATTLFAESTSRLINGKYITRMTPEQARRDNAIHNAPEARIKAIDKPAFKGNTETTNKDEQQKPLLSFDTLMKASAAIIAGGYAIKGARKLSPQLDNAMKNFFKTVSNKYNTLTEIENYAMPKEEFDKIIAALKKNGNTQLVEDYEKLAAKYSSVNKDGKTVINLGPKVKKCKPFVEFAVAPFKFAWNAVTLPYNLVNKLVKVISPKKATAKTAADKAKEIDKNTLKAFAKSIESIGKEVKKTNFSDETSVKKFNSFINDNFLKGFNVDTMSNVSNCDLSNLAKIAGNAATLWFLMADNYNMVMLKSNGNDVEGAKTKFKERFVQEVSRLFYQTLLIDLFNSTFSTQYHKSFFGVTWITLTNTTMGEWLTRKSVGVPVGTHSRKDLIEMENKQNNATGFKKAYFNFMKRLTGKRSVQSYNVTKEHIKNLQPDFKSPVNFASTPVNFTQNSQILNEIIKEN